MDENDEKAKRAGGIDFGDVGSSRDTNIQLERAAGRDIVTNTTNVTNYYGGTGLERKDEGEVRPLKLPDELPEVGDLPAGSRMVHRYNRFLVGREGELKALAQVLQKGETAAIGEVVGITGLGGVGKSQLAVALAYRYGRFFPGGVFWVSMTNPVAIEGEIAQCGGMEGMNLREDFASLELAMQVALVRREWEKPQARLLIFDNCEDERLLEEYRPKIGGCRVVVTSRKGNWPGWSGVQRVALDTLPRPQSVALLQKHVPDAAAAELEAIADELGDLPLALHLAGSFLEAAAGAVTVPGYLKRIRRHGVWGLAALRGEGVGYSPTKHELSVWRTFEVSYTGLQVNDRVHALAKRMLACAAWFAPGEPIPVWLLEEASGRVGEDERSEEIDKGEPGMEETQMGGDVARLEDWPQQEGDERELEDEERRLGLVRAQGKLVGLGLLMGEGEGQETVTMHRLVGMYVQGVAGAGELRQVVNQAVLDAARRLNNAGFPGPLLAWQSHLRYVTDQAIAENDETAAGLSNALGFHLHMIGEYQGARPHYERALAIREKVLGAEHPDTARSLNNLGFLLQAMGDYLGARPYYERALAINEKVLGAEHPDTALSLNNLGGLLRVMGNYLGARPYFEQALAINEKVLGGEHPDTARSLNNLGALLRMMGEYQEAQPYYERALVINEKVLGGEHPDTARSLNNLGGLLRVMGEYQEAQPYYERALAINEKVLGAEHPDTARSLNNLGGLLQAMGDYLGARLYYEQALAVNEKVLGAEHPDTARSLNNLGALLQAMGDYLGARPYYERALAIDEKVLGAEHPDTARSLNNLGALLRAMDDYQEARPYYERALLILEQRLGAAHPHTKIVRGNLEGLKGE